MERYDIEWTGSDDDVVRALTTLGIKSSLIDGHGEDERELVRSVAAALIDADAHQAPRLAPRLLLNDTAKSLNVLTSLEREFGRCERFSVSVAFVTAGGVTVLLNCLMDLERRGVRGRVLVSTYLGFNDPDALRRLRAFKNIELRAYDGPLHSKGYLFESGRLRTLVVGSSNLTQAALLENSEWNLLVNTYERGSLWDQATAEFERLWNSDLSKAVDDAWLERYAATLPKRLPPDGDEPLAHTLTGTRIVRPNRMQTEALANLSRLRERGATRALLVSATGTGKTYLAAFDVEQSGAESMLFVIHRERIARDAMESFRRVLGPSVHMGLCVGSERDRSASFVFATIQTLSRHLDEFDPHAFDYIVIDEAHHVGAKSYTTICDHFSPKFMLGMTATAQRMDGLDVYALFDNNIAYQITLQRAEEEHMLAPFHYFGIQDLSVDGEVIEEDAAFARLTSGARVTHMISEIELHTVRRERRGLVFCSRIDEARELSRLFNERGWRTIALDGSSTDLERERAIERLECDRSTRADWLELIFCRDIFNEGIDIPTLNLVVMCRPTESAVIFVQQLGRGLRKVPGKDYVLVLDFIGNYRKSYLIPIALSGDRTYNKDNIRRFMREGNRIIPGCSTVNFDEVTKEHIYRKLDQESFSQVRLVRQEYDALKAMLGRIPRLMDFQQMAAIDPALIFSAGKSGSYHAFLTKYEKGYHVRFTREQETMLRFASLKLASGKRIQDLLTLRLLMQQTRVSEGRLASEVADVSAALPVSFGSVASVLGGTFLTGSQRDSFRDATFCEMRGDDLCPTAAFVRALGDPEFRHQLEEVVELGIAVFRERYQGATDGTSLVLYQKYTYEDVCRLLEWDTCLNAQNIGGYKYDARTNTFPVFINYEKTDDVAESIRYQDRFVSPARLIALSKHPRNLDSPDIRRLKTAHVTGMRTFLFVRKNKDDKESKEFYYLGQMRPTGTFEPTEVAGSPAVEIVYDLDVPVADELFDYLTSSEG